MKKRSQAKAEQVFHWEVIILLAIISLFLIVIITCLWYYLAVYAPFVSHFTKTQEFFGYIAWLSMHHELR